MLDPDVVLRSDAAAVRLGGPSCLAGDVIGDWSFAAPLKPRIREAFGHFPILFVWGLPGSGKSTFMNIIGCLDTPNDGEYWLNGQLVSTMKDDELARVRNKEIGFVFQTFNLLPRATALHNVELPLVYAGISSSDRKRRAASAQLPSFQPLFSASL